MEHRGDSGDGILGHAVDGILGRGVRKWGGLRVLVSRSWILRSYGFRLKPVCGCISSAILPEMPGKY